MDSEYLNSFASTIETCIADARTDVHSQTSENHIQTQTLEK